MDDRLDRAAVIGTFQDAHPCRQGTEARPTVACATAFNRTVRPVLPTHEIRDMVDSLGRAIARPHTHGTRNGAPGRT
jgi:hypothetical protein